MEKLISWQNANAGHSPDRMKLGPAKPILAAYLLSRQDKLPLGTIFSTQNGDVIRATD